MTIRTRNKALQTLFIICIILIIASAALLIRSMIIKHVLPGPFEVKGYQRGAVIASAFLMLLYAAAASRLMLVQFEKTQSTEIVYFVLFLIAVLNDTARLCVPFFGLWKTASSAVNAIGRTVLFGRILAPLSLICAAAFSDPRERTNTNRNITLLFALSVAVSIAIPINTAVMEQNFAPRWGEGQVVSYAMAAILITAVLSFFISSYTQGQGFRSAIFVLMLIVGYVLLCNALTYFTAVIGGAALFLGTALYLTELHKQYLWK